MKSINIPIFFIALSFPVIGITQSFTLGDSAVLSISDGTTFFFGGNTTLNGKLSTTGSIVSYSDIDFVANKDVGNLKFTGTTDQQLIGDTLSVGDFETDKDGILALNSDQVRVTGTLIPFRGVIRSGEGKMVHAGNVIAEGQEFDVFHGILGFDPLGGVTENRADLCFEVQPQLWVSEDDIVIGSQKDA